MQVKQFLLFSWVIWCLCLTPNCTKVIYENPAVLNLPTDFTQVKDVFEDLLRRRCPLCDSSVYSYCSEKLFHDSCCCHNPNSPFDVLPHECKYADCNFLYANTCREHKLITACCCTSNYNNYYLFKK